MKSFKIFILRTPAESILDKKIRAEQDSRNSKFEKIHEVNDVRRKFVVKKGTSTEQNKEISVGYILSIFLKIKTD